MADVTSRHRLDRRDRPEPPGAAVHTQLAWLGAKADILATSEREQRAVVPRVIRAVIGLEAEARTGAPRTWSRKMAARREANSPCAAAYVRSDQLNLIFTPTAGSLTPWFGRTLS